MGQFARTERPCRLNWSDPKKNLELYGQTDAPCYDLSRVELRHISIYAGRNDRLVSPRDINITRSQLTGKLKDTRPRSLGPTFEAAIK